jgi:hypothetical protein
MITPHPDMSVQRLTIGRERAPLLVIDNVLSDADELADGAAGKIFSDVASYYPGVRAKAPLSYQRFVLEELGGLFGEYFDLGTSVLRFTACHYSLVTRPAAQLAHLQRIPHIDSLASNELAFVHYLFRTDLGGTAFYRHRRTGFEIIDESRKAEYFRIVEEERIGPHSPGPAYIHGDTPLYEQVGKQDAVFNRMVVYRRNSLHSGLMRPGFVGTPDPRTGRLSMNGFIAS